MTAAAPEENGKKPTRVDYKFWTVALLVLAVLAFNVAERLVLDADEADISYARLIVPAHVVTKPRPGDIFVFDHENNAFVESKLCSLQEHKEPKPVALNLRASNVWGSSVNATLASVGDFVPKKLAGLATVDHAERKWTYSKTHRLAVNAQVEIACLQAVAAMALSPSMTPFVVDAIYLVENTDGQDRWVRFADPLMLDPASCDGGCPKPKRLKDIVPSDAFTRFKVEWGIVRIQ